MSGMSDFADCREAVLLSEQLGLYKDPERAADWRREIALFRSLTDREAQSLEGGVQPLMSWWRVSCTYSIREAGSSFPTSPISR